MPVDANEKLEDASVQYGDWTGTAAAAQGAGGHACHLAHRGRLNEIVFHDHSRLFTRYMGCFSLF